MKKLDFSRREREEQPEKLNNLSPEKYGKGAYCSLTFTPSKLADNVIYRQASNLKRIEEESSKCREYETTNQTLQDQVAYLKQERDGISNSLNQMIEMYKRIISEMEGKNEDRLKEVQKKFKDEIQRYIRDKEEEAKFFQSEKEILEERIEELENELQGVKDDLTAVTNAKIETQRQLEQSQTQNRYLVEKLEKLEQKAIEDEARAKQQIEGLKKDFMMAEVNWKNTLNEQIHKKDKEIESLERTHRAQLEKLQAQRTNEILLKNQQLKQITKAFESESNRLNEIINNKDRTIDTLANDLNQEKTRVITLTREYQTEINHLSHEKKRLFEEVNHLGRDNEILAKDKVLLTGELQRENTNLRDLLYESSVQLQKCKNEFLGLAKQNSHLILRLKTAEEQAKTWRDSYYLNRSRP